MPVISTDAHTHRAVQVEVRGGLAEVSISLCSMGFLTGPGFLIQSQSSVSAPVLENQGL